MTKFACVLLLIYLGFAKANTPSYESTMNFLVSLENEIEELHISDNKAISKDELSQYFSYIKSAKDCLKLIQINSKEDAENSEDMTSLINTFNENMTNIEQAYKKMMLKTKNKCNWEQRFTKCHSLSMFDSISCPRNTRPIKKKSDFEEPEIVTIGGGDIIESSKSSQDSSVIIPKEYQ
ncbi:MAG: hypothetical protein LBM19_01550 [Holosporales bacterium]|jgi:transcriptional regulator of heat shock response|nr:hypothetical protein [Holosporales bacterium]